MRFKNQFGINKPVLGLQIKLLIQSAPQYFRFGIDIVYRAGKDKIKENIIYFRDYFPLESIEPFNTFTFSNICLIGKNRLVYSNYFIRCNLRISINIADIFARTRI